MRIFTQAYLIIVLILEYYKITSFLNKHFESLGQQKTYSNASVKLFKNFPSDYYYEQVDAKLYIKLDFLGAMHPKF